VAACEGLHLSALGLLVAEVDRAQGALSAGRAGRRFGVPHDATVHRGHATRRLRSVGEKRCARALTTARPHFRCKLTPKRTRGPQQHGEDCRDDRLQSVEMLEETMSSRHDHADDDVDNEQRARAASHRDPDCSPVSLGPGPHDASGRPGRRCRRPAGGASHPRDRPRAKPCLCASVMRATSGAA
jgi:hypothetical protein